MVGWLVGWLVNQSINQSISHIHTIGAYPVLVEPVARRGIIVALALGGQPDGSLLNGELSLTRFPSVDAVG